MGCGSSRSSPTLPVAHFPSSAHIIGDDNGDTDDDDDKNYARVCHTCCCHCGRRLSLPSHASLSNSFSNSFFSNSSPASITSPGPWLSNSSVSSRTSRSYSLLSTPRFHSPAPSARNKINLKLDPALFHDAISTACGVRGTNIDTACGSRFSGISLSPSCSLSAPSSPCSDERYPLPPLSVQTEPFPRLDGC